MKRESRLVRRWRRMSPREVRERLMRRPQIREDVKSRAAADGGLRRSIESIDALLKSVSRLHELRAELRKSVAELDEELVRVAGLLEDRVQALRRRGGVT